MPKRGGSTLLIGFVGAMVIASAAPAAAEDISGLITTTRVIREHSRLVGDVTCMVTGAPCISFSAPRISLRLDGFTMTGQADPTTGCGGALQAGEHGISTNNQMDVEIRGPGVVQRFRAHGVFVAGTVRGQVEGLTLTTNCQSGILVSATSSGISVASNISVRNGASQPGFPCGGI